MKVLQVLWDNDAPAVTDQKVAAHVDALLAQHCLADVDVTCRCGQESVVNELRIRVKRGQLTAQQLVFVYDGTTLTVHDNGRLPNWPSGFCDVMSNQLSELV